MLDSSGVWLPMIFLNPGGGNGSGLTTTCRLIPDFKVRDRRTQITANPLNLGSFAGSSTSHGTIQTSPSMYPHQAHRMHEQPQHAQNFHFPASPHLPAHPHSAPLEPDYQLDLQARNVEARNAAASGAVHYPGGYVPVATHHASELDAHYWKNMFLELGFGENVDPSTMHGVVPNSNPRTAMPQYVENTTPQHHLPHPSQASHHGMQPQQPQIHYQTMHAPSHPPTYGH